MEQIARTIPIDSFALSILPYHNPDINLAFTNWRIEKPGKRKLEN